MARYDVRIWRLLPFVCLLLAAAPSIPIVEACENCGCCRVDSGGTDLLESNWLAPPAASAGGSGGDGSNFRFAVVGDTQGLQFLQKLTTDMNAHNPALVVYPGDLVNTGSISAWNQWDSLSQHFIGGPNMRLPVPGNHDLPVGGDLQWQQKFN